MPLLPEKVYVTPDDFKNYHGLDLRNILRANDNESNQAESFLAHVTRSLKKWIDRNTFRNFRWEDMERNPEQLNSFKIAILEQAYYAWKEGAKAFGLDSGSDAEKGIIIKKNDLMDLQICEAALNELADAGIVNFTMKNRPRVMRGYPGLEFWGSWPDGGGIV